jgi:phosphoribosylformylglycinamidine synthase
MRFGIIVFPGSNCDKDCYHVIKNVLHEQVEYVWHDTTRLKKFDCIILPGGFSYGDYLRCGALAKLSPIIKEIKEHIKQGRYVIGICNGFQILTETKILPGILMMNKKPYFICQPTLLRVSSTKTFFTKKYKKTEYITLPIAHMEGRYIIDNVGLKSLQDNNQIVFRYINNPNGSVYDIAGIVNMKGNVLGMMPHPERASEELLGSTDGLNVFKSFI